MNIAFSVSNLQASLGRWGYVALFCFVIYMDCASKVVGAFPSSTQLSNDTDVTRDNATYSRDASTVSGHPVTSGGNNQSTLETNVNFDPTDVIDDTEQSSHTSVNLAIIPGLAVLFLIVALCIRGCKWFTEYAREGDKDAYDKYAAIVEQGDEDYDPIEMRSDTASTVYYDTVSSFYSFTKKSQLGDSMSSYSSKTDQSKFEQVKSPRSVKHASMNVTDPVSPEKIPRTKYRPERVTSLQLQRSVDLEARNKRKSPVLQSRVHTKASCSVSRSSSGDSSPNGLQDDDSLKSPRKDQRFKVSFITEGTNNSSTKNNIPIKDREALRPIISNARPTSMLVKADIEQERTREVAMSCVQQSSKEVTSNDNVAKKSAGPVFRQRSYTASPTIHRPVFVRCTSELVGKPARTTSTKTFDCGTQTDRSYRASASAKRARKRFSSDSGADETNSVPPTIDELTEFTVPKEDDDVFTVSSATTSESQLLRGSLDQGGKCRRLVPRGQRDGDSLLSTETISDSSSFEKEDGNHSQIADAQQGTCQCYTLHRDGHDDSRTGFLAGLNPAADSKLVGTRVRQSGNPAKVSLLRSDAVDCPDSDNDSNGNFLITGKSHVRNCRAGCDVCNSRVMIKKSYSEQNLMSKKLFCRRSYCGATELDHRSQCDMNDCDRSICAHETIPLVDKLRNVAVNCVKRDFSLASGDLSSSMTSLSSSGYAENYSSGSTST